MWRITLVGLAILAGCGARTSPGDAVTVDAGADAVPPSACGGLNATPRKLADLGPIEDEAAIAVAGSDAYVVVRPKGAPASVLQRVPLVGGTPKVLASDVACAGVASNGTHVGYSSTSGRFVALPLAGGAALSVELADRSRCPIRTIGKTFFVYFNGNTIMGFARWTLQGDPQVVTGPAESPGSEVDETYWFIPPRGTLPPNEPRIRLLPWADFKGNSLPGSVVPDDSKLIGQTAKELVVVTPDGNVLRSPKEGGGNFEVASSLGTPNVVQGDSIYAVGVSGAPTTQLARLRLADRTVTTLATATGKSIRAIGTGDCGVAWVEQDPPAVWARAK